MIWKRLLSLMVVTTVLVFVGCDNPTNSDNSGGDDTTQDDTSDDTGDDTSDDTGDDTSDDGTSDSDDWFNETPLDNSSDSDTDGGVDYTVSVSDLAGTYEYSDGIPSNDRTLTVSDADAVTWNEIEYDSVSIDGFTMTATSGTNTKEFYILGNSTGDKFLIADAVYGVHYPSDVTLSDIFDDLTFGGVVLEGDEWTPEYVFELTTGAGARGVATLIDEANDGWKTILNEDAKPAYFDSEITEYDGDAADFASDWDFNDDTIRMSFSYLGNTAPTDAENSTMVMTPADVASNGPLADRIVVNATPADIEPGLTINASNVALESDPNDTTIDLEMTFGFAEGQSVDDYESVKIERQVPGFVWQVLEDDVKSTISTEIEAGEWIYEDTSAEIPRAYNYRVTLVTPSGNEFVTTTDLLDPLVHCPAVDVEKTGNTGVDDNVGTYTFTAIEHAPVTVNVVKPDGSKLTAITLQHPDNSVTVGPDGSDADFTVSNDNLDDISYDVSFTRVFSFPGDPNEEEYTTRTTGVTSYTLYK